MLKNLDFILETMLLLFSHVRFFVRGLQHSRLPCPSLSQSLLRFMSIELVMLSHHLILCRPPLLLPSIFPSIRVFSNGSARNNREPLKGLEKAEEPEIKLPTSSGSSKKQESSRKRSISALLTMPKPLTVWITINSGKF